MRAKELLRNKLVQGMLIVCLCFFFAEGGCSSSSDDDDVDNSDIYGTFSYIQNQSDCPATAGTWTIGNDESQVEDKTADYLYIPKNSNEYWYSTTKDGKAYTYQATRDGNELYIKITFGTGVWTNRLYFNDDKAAGTFAGSDDNYYFSCGSIDGTFAAK